MRIQVDWLQPLRLSSGKATDLIYSCDLDDIPESPGVYVFARRFGKAIAPLYVGQAVNLRKRIEQQLNNVKLMMAIKRTQIGPRVLLVGTARLKGGQQVAAVLNIVESCLIENALGGGAELINKQGVKTHVHVINNSGNKASRKIAPLRMLMRMKK